MAAFKDNRQPLGPATLLETAEDEEEKGQLEEELCEGPTAVDMAESCRFDAMEQNEEKQAVRRGNLGLSRNEEREPAEHAKNRPKGVQKA